MPIEARPLFRPDVLRVHLQGFAVPPRADHGKVRIERWAEMILRGKADGLSERELLPDFMTDLFVATLGYQPPPGADGRYTLSREQHVEVDGQFADGAIGEFGPQGKKFVMVVEGKGPKDPLDRAHGGRKMSAVDQGFRYAINLQTDFVLLTNIRQTRLYYKGADQQTFERFDTEKLAAEPAHFKKLVFLLGAERVLPGGGGRCHLYDLLSASEHTGRELTREFYRSYADMRQGAFVQLCAANPQIPSPDVLTATQKILDRLLFCAFCEDRGLLPPLTIERAFAHADPYNPRPIWENFKGLFRSVNLGNPRLNIPKYNGGLFADDPLIDRLIVPDAVFTQLRTLGDYDYRPPAEAAIEIAAPDGAAVAQPLIDVDILGHIFEQSISDLERMRQSLDGQAAPQPEKNDSTSRRKREGAFYTPAFVTRYIVEQALGGTLQDRFEALRLRHEAKATKVTRGVLIDPRTYDAAVLKPAGRETLVRFWDDWQAELGQIRVLDPACGSGAFLVEAFDQLYAAYEDANDHLAELRGQRTLFDLDRQILTHNIFGVDLNEEAIEICRLSLWIKTAQRNKELTSLDGTIRVGNSVVDDPAVHPRAFDWKKSFPDVFAAGGFDVVVGNPPYVRQELLSAIKPHLQQRFASFHGMADLYVYFYELGLRLLRPGGRLSLVVTNKWLKAGYAEPLRKHLAEHAWVESLVDFGHAKQIFPDADVFPCILVAQKPMENVKPPAPRVAVIPRETLRIEDLSRQVATEGVTVPQERFGSDAWQLESPDVSALLEKLRRNGHPLRDVIGCRPLFGIKTGLNEAYVIDTLTKDALVGEDPASADLFRPFLRGQDCARWLPDQVGLWMIVIKSSENHAWPWAEAGDNAEEIFRKTYPAIHRHVRGFEDKLRKRQDQGRYWWELRSCAYWDKLANPKIVYPDIAWRPQFSLDRAGMVVANTIYLFPTDDPWVLTVFNSPIAWWFAWREAQHGKDEALRFMTPFVEAFPIPEPAEAARAEAVDKVARLAANAAQRATAVRTILDWLKIEFDVVKPTLKLQAPVELEADGFVAEVKKARGKSKVLSAAALAALKEEHARTIAPARALAIEALALERRLSNLVNAAYGLTPAEIALMWQTAPPRTPLAPG